MKEKELYILNLEYVRAEFVVTYCLCSFADFDFDKKDVTLVIEKPSYNKFKAFIDSLDERINLVIVDRKPKKLFNRAIYRKTLSEVKNAGKAIEYIRFLRAEKKIVKTAKADIKQLFEGKRFDKVVNVGNTSYYWVKLVEALKCKNKKYLELRSFIVNDPNTDYYIKNKFYAFNKNGVYNQKKTKKLKAAAKYNKNFKKLKKLLGKPKKTKYESYSCYGPGNDGYIKYANFTVYVYKYKGKVLYMGAE